MAKINLTNGSVLEISEDYDELFDKCVNYDFIEVHGKISGASFGINNKHIVLIEED